VRDSVHRYKFFFLLIALNYFAFRVEPFEDEYESCHKDIPTSCAFNSPTLTWETFDKDNAPQAFVFDAGLRIERIASLPPQTAVLLQTHQQYQPVRDKSPPLL
jgi:hypothetical protein